LVITEKPTTAGMISLSAIPLNNHSTKIIKNNIGNDDKFAQIKGKRVSL
jgi:hypothetical protein